MTRRTLDQLDSPQQRRGAPSSRGLALPQTLTFRKFIWRKGSQSSK